MVEETKKADVTASEKNVAVQKKIEPVKKEDAVAKAIAGTHESHSSNDAAQAHSAPEKRMASAVNRMHAPAAQKVSATEPPLPPEDKEDVVVSPIEADEIERASAATRVSSGRKLRRSSSTPQEKEPSIEVQYLRKIIAYVKGSLWVKISLGAVVVVGLLIYGILSVPSIVEARLPKMLAQEGIMLKSFKIKTIGLSGAELVNLVASSGAVRIRTVRLKYSFSDLWNKHHVNSMDIIGITLNGTVSQEKMSFGDAEKLVFSSSEKPNGFTVDKLKVTSGQFIINGQNQQNPFMLNFDAEGTVQAYSMKLKISFSFLDERFSVRGLMNLEKSKDSTQVSADIQEGNVLNGDQIIGAVTGTLAISVADARLTEAKANLSIETSEQNVALNTVVVPHEDNSFSFESSFERSFKEGVDAGDRFVGDMFLGADRITVSGSTERFTLRMPLKLSVLKATNGTVSVENMTTEMQGQLDCFGMSNCVYKLTAEAPFSLEKMHYAGTFNDVSLAQPLSFFFSPEERFLTLQKGVLYMNSGMTPFSLNVDVKKKTENSTFLSSTRNVSQLSLAYNLFTGAATGNLSVTGATATTSYFKTPNVSALVNFTQSALHGVKFIAKDVTLAQEGQVAPFNVQATVAPANAYEYTLDSAFQMMSGLISAKAKGSYNFRDRSWSLFVEVPKTMFSEAIFPFGKAFPSFARRFDKPVEGTFALNGRMNVADGKVTGAMKLLIMDFSTQIGPYMLTNMTTVLNITSLSPFETADNQNVFIGRADIGIPFKDVVVAFRAAPQGVLLSSVSMQYADAGFRLIKPVFVPYDGTGTPLLLEGQGISFSRLSELLAVPGMSVDGIGDVSLQVTYDKGELKLSDSEVYLQKNSDVGGMFQYNPPDDETSSVAPKMREFLKSVVFDDLVLKMNGPLMGKMHFDFILDGYASSDERQTPRKVSLNFDGSLSDLLEKDGSAAELPLGIQRSIQENFK